jgi:hypothetical protein
MDMETKGLFATFGPIVGMLQSIPLDPIITIAISNKNLRK